MATLAALRKQIPKVQPIPGAGGAPPHHGDGFTEVVAKRKTANPEAAPKDTQTKVPATNMWATQNNGEDEWSGSFASAPPQGPPARAEVTADDDREEPCKEPHEKPASVLVAVYDRRGGARSHTKCKNLDNFWRRRGDFLVNGRAPL